MIANTNIGGYYPLTLTIGADKVVSFRRLVDGVPHDYSGAIWDAAIIDGTGAICTQLATPILDGGPDHYVSVHITSADTLTLLPRGTYEWYVRSAQGGVITSELCGSVKILGKGGS